MRSRTGRTGRIGRWLQGLESSRRLTAWLPGRGTLTPATGRASATRNQGNEAAVHVSIVAVAGTGCWL
jgi:hypothetical protein